MFATDSSQAVEGARALGWASIGIGLTEFAAPQVVESMLGIEHRPEQQGILRVLGIRELLHGAGILAEQRATEQLNTGVWGRVAGDLLDGALLAIAGTQTKRPLRFAAVAANVGAIGLLDLYYATRTSHN
jgi:hypothetical protein